MGCFKTITPKTFLVPPHSTSITSYSRQNGSFLSANGFHVEEVTSPQRILLTCFRTQAPAAGAKKQKKKWSKGKVKDKAQHAVVFDKALTEKLNKDVQSYRLVTVATLVDRMKINGSLARQALADLEERGVIKPIVTHSKMKIYSTAPFNFTCMPFLSIRKLTQSLARAIGDA